MVNKHGAVNQGQTRAREDRPKPEPAASACRALIAYSVCASLLLNLRVCCGVDLKSILPFSKTCERNMPEKHTLEIKNDRKPTSFNNKSSFIVTITHTEAAKTITYDLD